MGLFNYKKKRNLKTSKEPQAKRKSSKTDALAFVIQEHHASHLHYDLRLEAEGVLKSWAIPKMPTMDPSVKRLAIMVEDHPYAYKDFHGIIPSGYGAGTVHIWDKGTYAVDEQNAHDSERAILAGLKKGSLHFSLNGKKLKGVFSLVKLNTGQKNHWLFIKKKEGGSVETATTNLDKIFWPKEKITKGDLIEYYNAIASYMVPHLKDRPVSLKRYPNGIKGGFFFQKNLENHPDWIETYAMRHDNKKVHYLLIQDKQSLQYAANLGSIELHAFMSRTQTINAPDYVVLDLDPKSAPFAHVIQVAQVLHETLEEIGIPSYCKTSGATGLHITIPLGAKYPWDLAKQFAELIARIVHEKLPKISTIERSISKRGGKVYIDYGQNNLGQTIVAPYSVRAREGATVSTPLKWNEVKKGLDPRDYTLKNIVKRVKKCGDLYAPTLGKGINLEIALKKINKL